MLLQSPCDNQKLGLSEQEEDLCAGSPVGQVDSRRRFSSESGAPAGEAQVLVLMVHVLLRG